MSCTYTFDNRAPECSCNHLAEMGSTVARDAPILPTNFLEKYVGKSKEQNAGKIGGKLEKWAPRNGSLAHFV